MSQTKTETVATSNKEILKVSWIQKLKGGVMSNLKKKGSWGLKIMNWNLMKTNEMKVMKEKVGSKMT